MMNDILYGLKLLTGLVLGGALYLLFALAYAFFDKPKVDTLPEYELNKSTGEVQRVHRD
jgi:hypothetical protein